MKEKRKSDLLASGFQASVIHFLKALKPFGKVMCASKIPQTQT
jgi:hypothetical protein